MDDDRTFSTEQEYFDGVRADGSKPTLHSRKMYTGATKLCVDDSPLEPAVPPVADEVQSPLEIEKERLHYEIDLVHLQDLDQAAAYCRWMMQLGYGAANTPAATPATAPAANQSPACQGRESGSSGSDPAAEPAKPQPEPEGTVPEGIGETDAPDAALRRQAGPPCHDIDASTGDKPSDQPAETVPVDASTGAPAAGEQCTTTGTAPRPAAGDSPPSRSPREPYEPPKEPYSNVYRTRNRRVSPHSKIVIPPPPDGSKAETLAEGTRRLLQLHGMNVDASSGTNRPKAVPDPDKPLTRAQLINVGQQGAKLLVSISEERAKVAHILVDMATKLDIRKEFMGNRAHALIHGLLLHLDENWTELGFGAWMPFRWPDQWLSFCGLLSRVLAANGLIYAKDAETYRKLLDETPNVHLEGTLQDRIKESKTPYNLARCAVNQGAYTMSELKTRLQNEYWDPRDAKEKRREDYWKLHLLKPIEPE